MRLIARSKLTLVKLISAMKRESTLSRASSFPSPSGPIILGFSGLPLAQNFKRSRLPGLHASEYRILQGNDSAAAIIAHGELLAAAAEERFDEHKHSSAFPRGAAGYCLQEGGLRAADIDIVAHSFCYGPEREFYEGQSPYYRDLYSQVLSPEVNRKIAERYLEIDLTGKFMAVPHHLAHAETAFAPSGFTDALILVSDGLGERHSASILTADAHGIHMLANVPAGNSLGLLYGLFTLYLGFEFADGEYKVMGLAPYGDRNRFSRMILNRWLQLQADGRYFVPLLLENVEDLDKETYRRALDSMERELGPRRRPNEEITQRHKDIASGLQAALEAAQLHLLTHYQRVTGLKRLCMAGGVALNCVANGVILRSCLFSEIYVQPAAGDDGSAAGAALFAARQAGERTNVRRHAFYGPAYTDSECEEVAQAIAEPLCRAFEDEDELIGTVAELIADGNVIGWFQGRMEFGPRALGNRSILGDPRRADMRDRINRLVKKREAFRPFAPVVLSEAAAEFFEIDAGDVETFADMLFVANVRPAYAPLLPATTHVDGSARVQTANRKTTPRLWRLLAKFGEITGFPILLNTSFNVAGQPIVRTPRQALDTFFSAKLDALVIGRVLVTEHNVRRRDQAGQEQQVLVAGEAK